jgi:MoxR-like ATPase
VAEVDRKVIDNFSNLFRAVQAEIGKAVVGHYDAVEKVLVALFAGGHVLLESVPGLGKTLLVNTLGKTMGLRFRRIQFTPDLMPADVTGTHIIVEDERGGKRFQFEPGPIFSNIILADEINRATPKTQSAFLEAMQERQVTVGGKTYKLDPPFFVLATQNPIDMEGTYPLPEAQMDRFAFKLLLYYTDMEGEREIIRRTTGGRMPEINRIISGDQVQQVIRGMKDLVRQVLVSSEVEDYVIRIIYATRPSRLQDKAFARQIRSPAYTEKFVNFGSSPRGSQAIILASKVYALLDKRANVSFEDVDKVIFPSLRHRLILNFEADVEGKKVEEIIQEIKEEATAVRSFTRRQLGKLQEKAGLSGRKKAESERPIDEHRTVTPPSLATGGIAPQPGYGPPPEYGPAAPVNPQHSSGNASPDQIPPNYQEQGAPSPGPDVNLSQHPAPSVNPNIPPKK